MDYQVYMVDISMDWFLLKVSLLDAGKFSLDFFIQ